MPHETRFTLIRDGLGRRYWRFTCTCARWEIAVADFNRALAKARSHERTAR